MKDRINVIELISLLKDYNIYLENFNSSMSDPNSTTVCLDRIKLGELIYENADYLSTIFKEFPFDESDYFFHELVRGCKEGLYGINNRVILVFQNNDISNESFQSSLIYVLLDMVSWAQAEDYVNVTYNGISILCSDYETLSVQKVLHELFIYLKNKIVYPDE